MAAMLHRLAENEVARVLAKLPEDTRLAAEECAVCYDAGSEDFETLGLFEGLDRLQPPPSEPADLPCITLYLRNLWDYSGGDSRTYRKEVRITYLHELGHYFGWGEGEMEALGLD